MKKIFVAIAALATFGLNAAEVSVTKTWAPNKIKECNQENLSYTVYTVKDVQVESRSLEQVQLSASVNFYRCLDRGDGARFYKVDPSANYQLPVISYNVELERWERDHLITSPEYIHFLAYDNKHNLLTEEDYRGGRVSLNLDLSELRGNKTIINIAPRILLVDKTEDGEEVDRTYRTWNQIAIELEVK